MRKHWEKFAISWARSAEHDTFRVWQCIARSNRKARPYIDHSLKPLFVFCIQYTKAARFQDMLASAMTADSGEQA
ncbi:MAG: hypothetical protein ACI8W7_003777 [Gammaproteobacteria bacterium]|jgi:hypothetical protein